MKGLARECVAEFFGTMVLILFGDGVVANAVLIGQGDAGIVLINICWGLAVIMGCLVSAGVSGAHLNPAVTVAVASTGGLPLSKVGPYILSQVVGAFAGAALVYGVYYDQFSASEESIITLNGIFHTFPHPNLSFIGAVVSEFVGTAALLCGIMGIGDSKNVGGLGNAGPWAVGALVIAIGMAMGPNTGYAINVSINKIGIHCLK